MDKDKLLARLDAGWEAFLSAWSGLSPEELETEGVAGEWSPRDIIAHVAWWEEESLSHLPLILKREKLVRYSTRYGGIDAFNALKTAEKRALSLDQVLAYSRETHQTLRDYLASLDPEVYRQEPRFVRRLRLDTINHYPEHIQALLDWRRVTGRGDSNLPEPIPQQKGNPEVDAYIARFPAERQALLNALRGTIRQAAPEAEERISYAMPGYFWYGPVVYFAMAKNHIGFYPTPESIDFFSKELEPFKSSKGAVQFSLESPLPLDLVRRIVLFKLERNREKQTR